MSNPQNDESSQVTTRQLLTPIYITLFLVACIFGAQAMNFFTKPNVPPVEVQSHSEVLDEANLLFRCKAAVSGKLDELISGGKVEISIHGMIPPQKYSPLAASCILKVNAVHPMDATSGLRMNENFTYLVTVSEYSDKAALLLDLNSDAVESSPQWVLMK